MNLNKVFSILILFFSVSSFSQLKIESMQYRSRIGNSVFYFQEHQDIHSSVLPLITSRDMRHCKGQLSFFFEKQQEINNGPYRIPHGRIYPIMDLSLGGEYIKNATSNPKYFAGIGAGIDLSFNNFFFTGKLLPYTTFSGSVRDSVQQILSADLGTTRPITENWFQRSEIMLAYKAPRFFSFIGGYGKNFFGEGYRSLLLSDNASNYPFFKMETKFGPIKYVNLYSILNDNSVNPADKSLDKMKFASTHYLSWNIIPEINLSIFESVVWQAKDTLIDRGFDVNYLNPIVFYRPVEYGNGSSDNVLLGMNLTYKINEHHNLYGQLVLDEFLLKEIKAGNQWWGNKYGFQFGYKSDQFLLENLYFQTELNMVRPFTYSHKNSVLSYGHLNASLAHPLGSNFYEFLTIASYKLNDHRITNKLTIAGYGIDTDSISYGQNIFASYSNRDGNYGHKTMQGSRQTVINETVIFETPLIEKIDLYINITYNYRYQWNKFQTSHSHFLMLGIRSRLWNVYGDI